MRSLARPSVSVIVPFAGSMLELQPVLYGLGRLTRRAGDEVIVADNRVRAAAAHGPLAVRGAAGGRSGGAADSPRIVSATGVCSPGFARNAGARVATGEWLLFIDADTEPSPSLIDDYFDPPPGERTAVMAGGIVDARSSTRLASRHSAARGQLNQGVTLLRRGTPYAQTANCAIRRSAFATVGGFAAEIRAGEDADICFRLARAGWRLEERPGARVTHRSRPTLTALAGQLARHGSGAAWLNRRYPGEFPRPSVRELVVRMIRAGAGSAAALVRGDIEAAAFALLDGLGATVFDLGRLLPNRAPGAETRSRGVDGRSHTAGPGAR